MIINNRQFDFIHRKSKSHVLPYFTHHVYKKLSNAKPTMTNFLNLAKAFDAVNYDLLLAKLNKISKRGTANNSIRSSPTNRTQALKINGVISRPKSINSSVPQATILGPLLFILYINDIFSLC